MQKEIGSNFDLAPGVLLHQGEDVDLRNYGITGSDYALLSTGRSAESLALDEIERRNPEIKKVALIPPFTCGTVIAPFLQNGYHLETYTIDENLNVDGEKFSEELVNSGAQVVLLHQYFGFQTIWNIEKIIEDASKGGVVFIEDRTQCLYSDFPILPVDYVVGSFRKWAALPDGGFVACRKGALLDKPYKSDCQLEEEKMAAAQMKYRYLHEDKGHKQDFLNKFKIAEDTLNLQNQYFKMSPSSLKVQSGIDIEELRRKRRENYARIYERLKNPQRVHLVTPEVNEREVPLYCALSVDHRTKLQEKLRDNMIYAPIVWPKSDICPGVCTAADKLYRTILCLPIDQRYDIDDMDRMLDCIEEFEKDASDKTT